MILRDVINLALLEGWALLFAFVGWYWGLRPAWRLARRRRP